MPDGWSGLARFVEVAAATEPVVQLLIRTTFIAVGVAFAASGLARVGVQRDRSFRVGLVLVTLSPFVTSLGVASFAGPVTVLPPPGVTSSEATSPGLSWSNTTSPDPISTDAPEMQWQPRDVAAATQQVVAAPTSLSWALPAAGAGLFMILLALGTVRTHGRIRRSGRLDHEGWRRDTRREALRLGLRAPPELRVSDEIAVPLSAGWIRRVVVVPRSEVEVEADLRRAVIVHEVAHHGRKDLYWQSLAAVVRALLWFSPGVLYLYRRLAFETERACDRFVLDAGVRPDLYARYLVALASDSHASALSLVGAEMGLMGRIRALSHDANRGHDADRGPSSAGVRIRALVPAGVLVVLGVLTIVAGFRLSSQPAFMLLS